MMYGKGREQASNYSKVHHAYLKDASGEFSLEDAKQTFRKTMSSLSRVESFFDLMSLPFGVR
jgi:hypothetical protein